MLKKWRINTLIMIYKNKSNIHNYENYIWLSLWFIHEDMENSEE